MKVLDGKVAIITGAAMGMGAATAELFASCGARVVVADVNDELGAIQARKIVDDGGEAVFARVDVACAEQVRQMVAVAVDRYGRLDIAVNNAARSPDRKPIAEMDENELDAVLNIDLKGVALCLKYEVIQMMAQGGIGSIINVSSISGIRPQAASPAYVVAKHSVIGLTRSVARDYSCHGIRINAIAPGAVDTPMLRLSMQKSGRDLNATGKLYSMLGRAASTVEIVQATMWLASEASSYVTGVVLPVDGGYTAM
jgi:glucose 1-dehydrogenase